MPDGADWRGVYFSKIYGTLHLVTEGDSVTGKWRTTSGDAWGELWGKADGDVLRFEWKQHKIGMVGPAATSKGRGYFRYVRPANGVDPDEIHGEWGLNEESTGNPWEAVRQIRKEPDPDSVVPDEVESRVQGGGEWDSSGNESPSEAGGGEE